MKTLRIILREYDEIMVIWPCGRVQFIHGFWRGLKFIFIDVIRLRRQDSITVVFVNPDGRETVMPPRDKKIEA